jgi:hypothetical protein
VVKNTQKIHLAGWRWKLLKLLDGGVFLCVGFVSKLMRFFHKLDDCALLQHCIRNGTSGARTTAVSSTVSHLAIHQTSALANDHPGRLFGAGVLARLFALESGPRCP